MAGRRDRAKERTEALLAAVPKGVDGAVGSGVAIVEVARMKTILARTPRFARRVFSAEECTFCERHALPEVPYALRFAAKSAVMKALGLGCEDGMGVRDVEVRLNAKGRPAVALSGRARRAAQDLGVVDLPLSLSFTHTDAVACVIAITRASQRVAEERVDRKEELARSFKEARALLDEMDSPRVPSGANEADSAAPADGGRSLALSEEAVSRAEGVSSDDGFPGSGRAAQPVQEGGLS